MLIDRRIVEDPYVSSKVFIPAPQPIQLTSITDVARSQPVTWTYSDVTIDVLVSLAYMHGVAQGLGGKERGAAGGWGTEGANSSRDGGVRGREGRGGGERVALTYLCRVLHATPIPGVVGTNPLCVYHAGWFEVARYADLVRAFTGAVVCSPGDANQFG